MGLEYNIGIRIMGVKDRIGDIERMLKSFDSKTIKKIKVFLDLHYGLGKPMMRQNAERAWSSYEEENTHILLLQDDLLLCKNFLEGLYKVVEANPGECICLCGRDQSIRSARNRGIHWSAVRFGSWGQANIMPVSMIKDFLEWCKRYTRPDYRHDDTILAYYLEYTQRRLWCTAPSLVEHLGATRSVIGASNKRKVATWFIGLNDNPVDFDWSLGLDKPALGTSTFKSSMLIEGTKVYDYFKDLDLVNPESNI